VSGAQRVNGVLDWLRRPADIRPRFITVYFDTVDTAGHRFGPDSAEVNAAIAEVDAQVGDLVARARAMGRTLNIVIAADHGMAAVSADRAIQLDTLIDRQSYIAVETGPYAAIEPVTGTDNRVYDALLKPHEHMSCYRKEDLPERLHYGQNARVAAIVCLAEAGWSIISGTPQYPLAGATHGWDPAWAEMDALFLANGPAFHAGLTLPTFDNVHVQPLLAQLIGVTPPASDGSISTLAPALINPPAPPAGRSRR
jgi:predicted AlkP superfamily pyrophosphatase or phosphodiesterase